MWNNMNLATDLWGASLYDHVILWVDILILVVIIMEGDFFIRKKKEAERRFKKFLRDAKKYFKHHEEVE
jgi:hypothetical protein